jgi:hypothetical protein
MNLIEAMEWVKRGYYIRRSWWKPDAALAPAFFDFGQELCGPGYGWIHFPFCIHSIVATDWEVGKKWEAKVGEYPQNEVDEFEAKAKRFIQWELTGEVIQK